MGESLRVLPTQRKLVMSTRFLIPIKKREQRCCDTEIDNEVEHPESTTHRQPNFTAVEIWQV